MILFDIPPVVISCPANINSGMAKSIQESKPPNNYCGISTRGNSPSHKIASREPELIANTMGIPIKRNITMETNSSIIILLSLYLSVGCL